MDDDTKTGQPDVTARRKAQYQILLSSRMPADVSVREVMFLLESPPFPSPHGAGERDFYTEDRILKLRRLINRGRSLGEEV